MCVGGKGNSSSSGGASERRSFDGVAFARAGAVAKNGRAPWQSLDSLSAPLTPPQAKTAEQACKLQRPASSMRATAKRPLPQWPARDSASMRATARSCSSGASAPIMSRAASK